MYVVSGQTWVCVRDLDEQSWAVNEGSIMHTRSIGADMGVCVCDLAEQSWAVKAALCMQRWG